MTTVNDSEIRAFLADEASRAGAAAPSLDEAVGALAPRLQRRASSSSQRLVVLLAAALLLVAALSAAIAVGSGLLRLPSILGDPGVVGDWASTDYNDGLLRDATQTMSIRKVDDGVFHVTVHDESSVQCSDGQMTITGDARLEDPSTLLLASPVLACVDGSEPSGPSGAGSTWEGAMSNGYRVVLDRSTDRLYDNREVVWTRGTAPAAWVGEPTDGNASQSASFSILHGEVTFRAASPWNDHSESYLDPRVFFLLGPGQSAVGEPQAEPAGMTMFVNPQPPETCDGIANNGIPLSAAELVQAVRANPNLEATAPVAERVGDFDAVRMDVAAAPGASIGPCGAVDVDVVYVRGRPWGGVGRDDPGRLYLLDLPGGSARTLAILIKAPNTALFQEALDAVAPVLDSFEFHAP